MATFTTYTDGGVIAASSGGNAASAPMQTVLTGTFDSSLRNLAAADVVEVVTIPAGTLVHNVIVEVITGEASQTVNVGDGNDPDGYVAVADASVVGATLGAGALVGSTYYAAADTIDVEVPATKAFTVVAVKVIVECTIT